MIFRLLLHNNLTSPSIVLISSLIFVSGDVVLQSMVSYFEVCRLIGEAARWTTLTSRFQSQGSIPLSTKPLISETSTTLPPLQRVMLMYAISPEYGEHHSRLDSQSSAMSLCLRWSQLQDMFSAPALDMVGLQCLRRLPVVSRRSETTQDVYSSKLPSRSSRQV